MSAETLPAGCSRPRPRRRVCVALIACTTAAVVVAIGAGAHPGSTVIDRDDSAGPLDLAAARHQVVKRSNKASSKKDLRLELVTYERWSTSTLGASSYNLVGFEFDLSGSEEPDRCVDVHVTRPDTLEAQVKRCDGIPEPPRHTVRVARPDAHSARIVLPRRFIARPKARYRWRSVTSYEEEGSAECPPPELLFPERRLSTTCVDRTRWVRARR